MGSDVYEGVVEVGDIKLAIGFSARPNQLTIIKPPPLIDDYRTLVAGFERPNIVEIGIAHGGSTALLAAIAEPAKLVSLEYEPDRLPLLDRFLEGHDLTATVRPHFGVDQSDRSRVAEIVAEEFAGLPLDLVIDDASHRYDQTLASFEVLFPLLRPGGLFVIEDWVGLHQMAAALRQQLDSGTADDSVVSSVQGAAPPRSLARLAIELLLTQAASGADVVAEVRTTPYWICARRGPAALGTAFRLADGYVDDLGLLG
jgi:predicted O-methyltransferase YrrM